MVRIHRSSRSLSFSNGTVNKPTAAVTLAEGPNKKISNVISSFLKS